MVLRPTVIAAVLGCLAAHGQEFEAASVKPAGPDPTIRGALPETPALLLFAASLEWLTETTVQGKHDGMLRLGY